MLMGITDYARHRDCGLQAVQQAVKAGRISRRPDGLVDSDIADQEWERNTMHSNARFGRKGVPRSTPGKNAAGNGAAATGPAPDGVSAANGHVQAGRHRAASHIAKARAAEAAQGLADPERISAGPDYSKARAAKEVYEAKIRKLDFEQRLGNLISKKQVQVAAFNRARVLRDAFLNIPTRLSAQLAAETDAITVHELLEQEIRKVLEEFAGTGAM
jgi:hypothetical protein